VTPTRLMTFAEFEQLPTPKDGRLELRNGEVVKLPPPKLKHVIVQENLRGLLKQAAGDAGSVYVEIGFQAFLDGNYRIADVAFVPTDRLKSQDPEGYFRGAPDLVIEVLSPSNTAAEMREKKKLCLENGAIQFWIADTDLREVEVCTRDGRSITYKSGQEIPLFFGGSLPVDVIFA
jgi:Uma2 family endonuclease